MRPPTDIVNSDKFTGVPANYLRGSIEAAGIDPASLSSLTPGALTVDGDDGAGGPRPWRDIWGCGQGVATSDSLTTVRELVSRLSREFKSASDELAARLRR